MLIVAVVVVYAVFFSWACGWLAERKGYDDVRKWQWLGLFFGVFALLVIGFSPEYHGVPEPASVYVVCQDCGLHLPDDLYVEHRAERHSG